MNTGLHDLTFSDYLALEAWGSSSLKAMRKGPPARVEWERTARHEDTDATRLGTAVHCALLTPDLYERQYAIKPEGMNFSTKEGKAWRDDPCRAGRTLLSHDVGAQVEAIVAALRAKPAVDESLVTDMREWSLLWDCSETGERCKARPDWMQDEYIYDLKVSRHASGGYLALRAYSEGWMHQLAHYRRGAAELGLPIQGGRLVVVDPTAPHFVYTLEVKRDALDLLELENIQTLKALRECRVAGVWPGTAPGWTKVEPPAGANMLIEETEEVEVV
jgi:hypothetical protein